MGEEIGFENGRFSYFKGLVTLTLTLDRVILHTIVHHSSTSTYIPNFIEIEETFCGRTDGHLRPTFLGRLGGVNLKIKTKNRGKFVSKMMQNNVALCIAVALLRRDAMNLASTGSVSVLTQVPFDVVTSIVTPPGNLRS